MTQNAPQSDRGIALVQALVIVAAIAAIAAALMLRAGAAYQRLDTRNRANQAALYLDSGALQARQMLEATLRSRVVHPRQDWAQPRAGMEIGRGELAWRISDLQGRFNLNALSRPAPEGPQAQAAFLRLAQAQGLSRELAQELADMLSETTAGGPVLPLAHPRQLAPYASAEPEAFARLLPLVAALSSTMVFNVNTLRPEVLSAWAPEIDEGTRRQFLRRAATEPFTSQEALMDWATAALDENAAAQIGGLPLTTVSRWFSLGLEAQLDTGVWQRTVVVTFVGAQEQSVVHLMMPEPLTMPLTAPLSDLAMRTP